MIGLVHGVGIKGIPCWSDWFAGPVSGLGQPICALVVPMWDLAIFACALVGRRCAGYSAGVHCVVSWSREACAESTGLRPFCIRCHGDGGELLL